MLLSLPLHKVKLLFMHLMKMTHLVPRFCRKLFDKILLLYCIHVFVGEDLNVVLDSELGSSTNYNQN